jgi:hypothetical protein
MERKKIVKKATKVDQCYIFTFTGKENQIVAVHKSSIFPDPAKSPVMDVLLVTGRQLSQLVSM